MQALNQLFVGHGNCPHTFGHRSSKLCGNPVGINPLGSSVFCLTGGADRRILRMEGGTYGCYLGVWSEGRFERVNQVGGDNRTRRSLDRKIRRSLSGGAVPTVGPFGSGRRSNRSK